ncbi:cytochrome c oxidase assembly protein [uncultured Amnibacterium sp.]|uniref:cytochrome c oxidase assembly protein n=1 Tax=uncultured Amnibacterium sp. TaxID=1631851 RepID=UPI0035CA0EA1
MTRTSPAPANAVHERSVQERGTDRRGSAPAWTVRVAGPAVVTVVALLAAAAALEIGGAARPLALGDPGPVVRWGLPAVQVLVDLGAAGALGTLVLACFAIPAGTGAWDRALDTAAASAAVWTVAAVATGVFEFADDVGGSTLVPFSGDWGNQLLLFLTDNPAGQAWLQTAVLTAVVTVLCIAVRSPVGTAVVAALAGLALVPMALQGHAGATATASHDSAITSFGLHIVFAAVWLGGLIALTIVGRGLPGDQLAGLVRRYSSIALVAYLVVAVSGVVNAAIRLGSIQGLLTPYGALIIIKALALVAMGGLGALYRLAVIRRIPTATGRRAFWSMVGAELGLMGVASGFAAALSRTAPPVTSTSPTAAAGFTPAQILTDGQALPPAPSFVNYVTQWHVDLIWVLLCGFLLLFYWAGVVRLRRRGDAWPLYRPVLWTIGVLLLFVLTSGGLNEYEKFLFSAHMLLHMMLTMVVPLLLVPAAPVTLAMRAIARRRDGSMGGREWLLLVVHSKPAGVLANPVVAGALFAGSLVVFYYTPVFSWATTDHVGHEWMTAHFLVTGYLFVQSLVGVDPLPHRWPYPLRLLVLLATMAFHAFFGLSLLNGKGLLLADWYGAMGWGTSALADQQTAGGIAWSVGEIPTLVLAIVVAVSWSRSDERDSRRLDRAADRDGDADLTAYNDMLARLRTRT